MVEMQKRCKLQAEHLPGVLVLLETLSFEDVGKQYGVGGTSVRYFIKKNGLEPKNYLKREIRGEVVLATAAEKVLAAGWKNEDRPMRDLYAEYLIGKGDRAHSGKILRYEQFKRMQEAR